MIDSLPSAVRAPARLPLPEDPPGLLARAAAAPDRIEWLRVAPFLVMHAGCLLVFMTGTSPAALVVAAALYALRMFAITAFYHRYFAHRAFETSRSFQFVMALLGLAAVQRGPLWWASHHRLHHRHSDTGRDLHSPRQRGFWWSHTGWFLSNTGHLTHWRLVRDLCRYPELLWLDRHHQWLAILSGAAILGLGVLLEGAGLVPSAWQVFVWGFFVSTVLAYHATYTINSLAHVWGRRRYATPDDSRNNFWLALLTFGEGWHNNHHRYPVSARQGFARGEIDLSYLGLCLLARCGLVRNLRPVPPHVHPGGRTED